MSPPRWVLPAIAWSLLTSPGLAETGVWPFVCDSFAARPALDLRFLNERQAGESGFVRLSDDGNDFVLGNGRPVRFWGVSCGESGDQLDSVARWLASIGVNLVRICSSPEAYATVSPKGDGSKITDVDGKAVEKAWRMTAVLKKHGIYTMITPYWVAKGSDVTHWGIAGYSGRNGGRDGLWGLLFFNEDLQRGYKRWMKELLARENPHTGIPLAKDPAVAMILLQNEDSLLWWTVNSMADPQKAILGEKFAAWAVARYGSLDEAYQRWNGSRLAADAPEAGRLGFYPLHEATRPQAGGKRQRVDDQVRFFAETMHAFNAELRRYLRDELGCRQLIIAENWKTADPARLLDAERWAYSAGDVIAKNHYFGGFHEGPRAAYRIEEGDLLFSRSALTNPTALPANMKQLVGHPHVVTESSWVNPNLYQAEGPLLTAAYLSLSGLDGYVWFVCGPGYGDCLGKGEREPAAEPAKPSGGYAAVLDRPSDLPRKWEVAQPTLAGMFPAAAIAYRNGYIQAARPVVHEARSMDEIWRREIPLIWEDDKSDPNRDLESRAETERGGAEVDPLAFLVGRVETEHGGDPARCRVADLSPFLDRGRRVVRSVTGEITLDYGNGVCTIDAPKAQGVCGFLNRVGTFRLADVAIASRNEYAAVLAVPLDDRPLAESKEILIQVGSTARPTGWKTEPALFQPKKFEAPVEGERILAVGKGPWQVVETRVSLAISNSGLQRATHVAADGRVIGEVASETRGGAFRIELPADCMYLILE